MPRGVPRDPEAAARGRNLSRWLRRLDKHPEQVRAEWEAKVEANDPEWYAAHRHQMTDHCYAALACFGVMSPDEAEKAAETENAAARRVQGHQPTVPRSEAEIVQRNRGKNMGS